MSGFLHFLTTLFRSAVAEFRAFPIGKKVVITTLVLGVIVAMLLIDVPPLATFQSWSYTTGRWFIFLFAGLYIGITQLPIPRTLLTLSAGVLFGPSLGILIALVCTTVSAALSLTIVRYFLGDWIRPQLSHPAVVNIDRRLKQRGWLAICSLRMIAGIPFSILNYVAALSSVPLVGFTIATLVGSAPGTIATVILGDALATGFNPALLIAVVLLAGLGLSGLYIDAKLPLKIIDEQSPRSQG
ncbi:TVP38/TMEM64 family inner membrane protein ydjZ [Corynebacterium kutscheri]|uniref:TVP38/TMEM64 family membrane protein n=1 Tax=Corynebacterium kutscheri TaxID=35755 RepID=A0A0F6R0D1_9CORY|nr:TVP38/TMEM64 family protein [Corynebacterium kutscheri]AKE41240.1 hypothetical protein UL82_05325 [Corynebacterium kutscheri]VEH08516.1 TVP38/TMEM64 family inner membrane protein ydjZ [Corynebacterium kutscheri]VEH09562.1 TVP38/TMEM64 family inner membrane protein ydjZ [Corynebacterium kutscheri]VEH79645.1 TVP38/TMEM64 family inner membrane protein ydjZ [Corynebacterium kutscheri]